MAKFCPNCGNPLDEGTVFCGHCGAKADGSQSAQPVQPYAPQQPYQPAPQYGAPQQPKKKNAWPLVLTGAVAAIAVLALVLIKNPAIPLFGHRDAPVPTETGGYTVDETEPASEPQPEAPTMTIIERPAGTLTEQPTVTLAEQPAVTPAEQPTVTPAEQPTVTPAEQPTVTPAEPPKELPYMDSIGEPAATDFAWISDAQSGTLPGSSLGTDGFVGKWKGELVFDGAWELVYVTIDWDAKITIQPCRIIYGEEWEDESGAEPYLFSGAFDDDSTVSGEGNYGSIYLHTFLENGGTQYGVGVFSVNNGNSAAVYLVRP